MAARCPKDEVVLEERFAAAFPAIGGASLPKSDDSGARKAIANEGHSN
jgi:hypothetical protein